MARPQPNSPSVALPGAQVLQPAQPQRDRVADGTAAGNSAEDDGAPGLGRAADPRRQVQLPDRNRIDGLAIGAPVTAAFVGVLLAQGELGGAGAEGSGSDVAAANGSAALTEGVVSGRVAGPAAVESQDELAGGQEVVAQNGLDPVSVAALEAAAAEPLEGGERVAAGSAAAGVEAAAGGALPGGAITVNLSVSTLSLGDLGLEDGVLSDGDLPPLGTLAVGSAGDDTLIGTERSDQLEGGAGDDLIYGLGGNDWLDGGDGDDGLYGGDGADVLLGGSGQDRLDGGGGDDRLYGGDGADMLSGGSGRDQLDGGTGNDSLDGGSGADRLSGGSGDDLLIVDNRADLARENAYGADGGGTDSLQIEQGFSSSPVTFVFGDDLGAGADDTATDRQQIDGEIENLILTGSVSHDAIGDGRANSLVGNAGANALFGGAGDDLLEGHDGDDRLDGGLGSDRLDGGAGRDILDGGEGADTLFGGADDDLLSGGLGADQLYGEAGDDAYRIGLNDSAVDSVFDHEGSNHIVLEGVSGQTIEAAIVGDDLYLVADDNPVAVIQGYVGHEENFAGVDLGAGIVAVEDLLRTAAAEPEPSPADLRADSGASPSSDDLLASYLPQPSYLMQPSLVGIDASDQLVGTGGSDWLSGLAGDDHLQGAAGSDVLEGGEGSDLLQGGAGDDRYLFTSGQTGMDTIRDAEGSNVAELHGFTGARLEGVVVGQDLIVVADYAPVFKVENYVGNEASFAGLQVDDGFVATDDLFN